MRRKSIRPREPDGEVRHRLLDVATELFTKKGYAATTVREIVNAAGVTPPVLYYYFENKEGLFLSLMKEPWGLFEAEIGAARCNGVTARERLRGLCDRTLSLFQEKMGVARLMYTLYYGPPQGAPFFDFDAYHDKFWAAVRELVEEGVGAGEFCEGNVDGMLWAVIGALNIALELELTHPERALGPKGLSRVLDVVFRGMAVAAQETRNS